MLVSFLIATYNRGQILVDCLRKVAACGLPEERFEIIVVDNASTDGTPELLAEQMPEVQIIRLTANRGPVAKNHALAQARGAFVVFLDDDAYPLPGAVPQMIRHFAADPHLGAAVFDVTLPDGSKECAAYPDVFIGAGTGFPRRLVQELGGLPQDFFMQAEEYDLSFRLLAAGYRVRHFADLPLRHLKTPGARIATRTTRLDVRNNLYLLARYVPTPLCYQLASDWLTRYFYMAQGRDAAVGGAAHRAAYTKGAAEGLAKWSTQRRNGQRLLDEATLERIFKFRTIEQQMVEAQWQYGFRRVLLADFGKNMLAYYQAAQQLGLQVGAIADDSLCAPAGVAPRQYRGTRIEPWHALAGGDFDAVIVANMSPVHAARRAAALRRVLVKPVIDLFERASCNTGKASAFTAAGGNG